MTKAAVFLFDPLLSDAEAGAMVRLCERFGTYGLYATEVCESDFAAGLPQRYDAAHNYVRTGGRFGRDEDVATLAQRTNYLRETYAYGEEIHAPGIEPFRTQEGFFEAARELFGRPIVEPAIVYANLLLPGQELAVHTDVPEFRGANRKVLPQWLMVVMHHSGLFDRWRMPIATGIAYFGHATGGALAYYPNGPDGAPEVLEARHNTGVLLDTDSVFHGVDRVGTDGAAPLTLEPGNVVQYDGGATWTVRSVRGSEDVLATLDWDQIRFSISWKAYCFADEAERDAWRAHADDLTLEFILATLVDDLCARGVLDDPHHGLSDIELAKLLIDTYERYPEPARSP